MVDLAVVEQQKALELSLLDRSNPAAVVNLVSVRVREAIERIPDEFFTLDIDDLEKFASGGQWSKKDTRLQEAFWLEYSRAQSVGRKMIMSNVFQGVCSEQYFYAYVLENKAKLALILRQPVSVEIANREMLSFSTDKLRDALSVAHQEFKKKPDPKWLDVLLRVHQMIDQRVNGAIIQRIQQHNINENKPVAQPAPADADMGAIDKELADLRSKLHPENQPRQVSIEDAVVVTDSERQDSDG